MPRTGARWKEPRKRTGKKKRAVGKSNMDNSEISNSQANDAFQAVNENSAKDGDGTLQPDKQK